MLENISNHRHPSRINTDYQEVKRGRRHDIKRNTVCSLNPGQDISHGRKEMPVCIAPYSPPPFLSVNISAMVSSHKPSIPALRFMNCWVWTAQPILTVGRKEGGSHSPGSSPVSLLLILTSHVRQRSTESAISFPFSSFGYNSSPGYNRSSHFRDITK